MLHGKAVCYRTWLIAATLTAVAGAARAATFYVAPSGDDHNAGALESPFASVQRAQAAAAPGDTVYLRGGTYRFEESQIARKHKIWAYCVDLDKSGARGKRIKYWAYRDERPVFDFSAVKPAGLRIDAFYVSGSWLHLKGLEITGVQVTIKEHTQSIAFENDGSHNIYEQLSMHDSQAIGLYSVRGGDNLFLNCDAYRNHDFTSENGKGGNVDGFGCHPPRKARGNVFRGCRAWLNSDDGFDCIGAHEPVIFENCWALANGFATKLDASGKRQPLGDGNGFKAGGYGSAPADKLPNPIPRHTVRFCLAVHNKANGFYANHHPGGGDWLNNSACRNGADFNMLGRLADNRSDVDGYGHKLVNNLGYQGRAEIVRLDAAKCELMNNTFTLGVELSDRDFVALDESELAKPRQASGELPAIGFLRPAAGSAPIDKGCKIGFPFRGSAPDLGAFEE